MIAKAYRRICSILQGVRDDKADAEQLLDIKKTLKGRVACTQCYLDLLCSRYWAHCSSPRATGYEVFFCMTAK